MSLAAYQRVAQVTETSRQTEVRLLADVTRELQALAAGPHEYARRLEVTDWNRQVWLTFALDCGQADNPLPAALRAKIVSLGMWVYKYTAEAGDGADLQPLIDVNQAVMKGLMGKAQP
jgi:flagellar biosynthesis activator protein FlaF